MITVKENKIPGWNETVEVTDVLNADAANGEVLIPYTEADQKLVVLIKNSATAEGTVTIKAGEMPMSGNEDLVLTIPASKTVALALESGRHKFKDGYVHASASATTIGFQLIAMP